MTAVRALAVLAAAGGLAVGPATSAAAWQCYGTAQTAGVCYELNRTVVYEDCVYLGSGPRTPVVVRGYDVDCGGWLLDAQLICEI